jgi:Flp pilus assembly protein TadG
VDSATERQPLLNQFETVIPTKRNQDHPGRLRNMNTTIRNFRSRNQERTGGLAVEMALCLPVLVMLLFGCFEMAHANMLIHSTESAAYEGARVGIIPGASPEKIKSAAGSVLRAVGINNFTVKVTPDVIRNDTKEVTVEIAVPFKTNTSIPAMYMQDPTFRGSCTLSREVL